MYVHTMKHYIIFRRIDRIGLVFRHLVKRVPPNSVMMFHSGCSDQGKEKVMEKFCTSTNSELRCILASSAFSMGKFLFSYVHDL